MPAGALFSFRAKTLKTFKQYKNHKQIVQDREIALKGGGEPQELHSGGGSTSIWGGIAFSAWGGGGNLLPLLMQGGCFSNKHYYPQLLLHALADSTESD